MDEKGKISRVVIQNDNPIHGTKLLLNGAEVPHLVDVSFSHPVGELAQVEAKAIAMDGFTLEVDARAYLNVVVPGGCTLEVDHREPGVLVYRSVLTESREDGDE